MAKKEAQAIYVVKDDSHKKVKFLSFKLDRSMSDIVREALEDYFKKPEIKKILESNQPDAKPADEIDDLFKNHEPKALSTVPMPTMEKSEGKKHE